MIVTPEGITYRLLWLPDIPATDARDTRKTLTIWFGRVPSSSGTPPTGLATPERIRHAQKRFDKAVKNIWGQSLTRYPKVGEGTVISGTA